MQNIAGWSPKKTWVGEVKPSQAQMDGHSVNKVSSLLYVDVFWLK